MSILTLFSTHLTRFFGFGMRSSPVGVQSTGPSSEGGTNSGQVITDDRSLQVSVVFACARLLTELVASMPLNVYLAKGRTRRKYTESTLHNLFFVRPNLWQTYVEFMETMMVHLVLRGNAYAVIQRNAVGDAVALIPIPSDAVNVNVLRDGTPTYEYQSDEGTRVFSAENILHIRLFGTSRYIGLSPLGYARESLGLSVAATSSEGKFFSNGSRPSGVLMIDKVLTKEQREQVRERFKSMYEGGENAFKLFLLEAGMKYQQLGVSPADAQLLQSRALSNEDICRFFRVPPFLVGITDKVTSWGSGLEQQNRAFLTYTIQPYLVRIQEAINARLVSPDERGTVFVEFDRRALLFGDSQAQATYFSTMAQNGIMTREEIREEISLPPIDGSDKLTVQVNLTPLDMLGAQPSPNEVPDNGTETPRLPNRRPEG